MQAKPLPARFDDFCDYQSARIDDIVKLCDGRHLAVELTHITWWSLSSPTDHAE
jgi:hypothetical protein